MNFPEFKFKRPSMDLFRPSRSAKVSIDLESAPHSRREEKILEYEFINKSDINPVHNYSTQPLEGYGSQYLDLKDIKQRAIQVFYTEEGSSDQDKQTLPFYQNIIHPNNRFRRTFDFITVVWVLYLVFFIPFEIGFDWFEMPKAQKLFLNLLDVWFAIDIILNFRTGYIQHGTIVMDSNKIIR